MSEVKSFPVYGPNGEVIRVYDTNLHGAEAGAKAKQFAKKNEAKGFSLKSTGGKVEEPVKEEVVDDNSDHNTTITDEENVENSSAEGNEEVNNDDEEKEEVVLADMTVAQLKKLAVDQEIDLGEATKKDDIIKVIEEKLA